MSKIVPFGVSGKLWVRNSRTPVRVLAFNIEEDYHLYVVRVDRLVTLGQYSVNEKTFTVSQNIIAHDYHYINDFLSEMGSPYYFTIYFSHSLNYVVFKNNLTGTARYETVIVSSSQQSEKHRTIRFKILGNEPYLVVTNTTELTPLTFYRPIYITVGAEPSYVSTLVPLERWYSWATINRLGEPLYSALPLGASATLQITRAKFARLRDKHAVAGPLGHLV